MIPFYGYSIIGLLFLMLTIAAMDKPSASLKSMTDPYSDHELLVMYILVVIFWPILFFMILQELINEL